MRQHLLESVEKRCLLIIARAEGFPGFDRSNQKSLRHEDMRLGQLKKQLWGRFRKYSHWKLANKKDCMEFRRWLIITAINTDNRSLNGRFLLTYPELTWDIFYSNKPWEENTTKYGAFVSLPDWKSFAPFIYPLCTEQNVAKVFEKLVESTEAEANSLLPIKRRKTSERKNGFIKKTLSKYIDNLRRLLYMADETHNKERAVLVKWDVKDITGMPSRCGRLILTKNHLVFDNTGLCVTKSRVYDIRKLSVQKFKIPGIIKRDCGLKLREWKETNLYTETTLSFSGGTNVRDQVWNACNALIEIHQWLLNNDVASKQTKKLIENRCLRNVCDNIIREEALISLVGVTSVSLQEENMRDLIVRVTQEMTTDLERISPNKRDLAFSMKDFFAEESFDVDPERQTRMQSNTKSYKGEIFAENDSKLEMMTNSFKLLQLQIAPLFILRDACILILIWEDVGISLTTLIMLILVWWKDCVAYIPSTAFFLNALLLIAMKNGSKTMNSYYYIVKYWVEARRGTVLNNEFSSTSVDLLTYEDVKKRFSLIRDQNHNTQWIGKETVAVVQGKVLALRNSIGRLSSLYTWKVPEKSESLCILSLIICGCLLYIPIKHLYLLLVLWAFRWGANRREQLQHFRREKSPQQEWWEEVPILLPNKEDLSSTGSL